MPVPLPHCSNVPEFQMVLGTVHNLLQSEGVARCQSSCGNSCNCAQHRQRRFNSFRKGPHRSQSRGNLKSRLPVARWARSLVLPMRRRRGWRERYSDSLSTRSSPLNPRSRRSRNASCKPKMSASSLVATRRHHRHRRRVHIQSQHRAERRKKTRGEIF